MRIQKIEALPSIGDDFGSKKIHNSGFMEIFQLSIKAGDILDRNNIPQQSIFIVQSGRGIIEAGQTRKVVEGKTIIELEANTDAGWINAGEEDLELICIKFK
jgi:quercetin dioxygenase-like cupin family protein